MSRTTSKKQKNESISNNSTPSRRAIENKGIKTKIAEAMAKVANLK